MRKLIREIHRRSLWQVVGIYLAGSYGALEVVGLLTDNLGLPSWFPGLAFGLLVLGLPIVVATAFVQEGVGRRVDDPATPVDESLPLPQTGARRYLNWRYAGIGGAVAAILWIGVALGWVMFGRGGEDGDVRRTIAVLPFATRVASEEDRFFAEGMHDDLLTQLAKIDSLTVISRTSVMQYAETTKSIRQIAEELQVATILEGGVQRAGDRVRVNVQLINAATDQHIWAETYDEDWTAENVFAIQTDLARKIASALRARLTPETERRIEAHGPENERALELYFQARYAYENRGVFGRELEEVVALCRSVIEADSTYAPAWAMLAHAYLAANNWEQMPPDSALPLAEEAIERALALDPETPEAHVARARLLSNRGEYEEALEAAERGIELHPGSTYAHGILGTILESLGRREEAVAASRRAVELDPLSVSTRHLLADRLFFAGEMDAAAAEARKVIEMEPQDWYGYYNLGWALAVGGAPADAVRAFQTGIPLAGENVESMMLALGYGFALMGQRDSALAAIQGLQQLGTSYDAALVYFELGDIDRAFADLAVALRADPSQVRRMRRDPSTRDMVAHPRFAQVLRELGLD